MSDHDMDLLFSAASASIRASAKSTKPASKPSLLDESQWAKARGIALVHAETETLLGNFQEWVHPSGARRLTRADWPISIAVVESVSGSWWLGEDRQPEPRADWHDKRPCIMHLHLEPLGLHAPAVEIRVHCSYGGIARAELVEETKFAGQDGSLVWLPAGMNLLEVMGLDEKINLRREVGL